MVGKRSYYPQLDGLRAISIALVVIGHELIETPAWECASIGVLLFFILSGFLITTLLCEEELRDGRVSLRAFYFRRALRILPAMFLFLFVVALLTAAGKVTDVPWSNFAVAALYVRNIFGHGTTFGHLWSLSLEEQFYFSWPFLFIITPRAARLRLALAIIAAVAVWRGIGMSLHLFDYNMGIYYMRTDFRFDSILSGCALALTLRAPHDWSPLRRVPPLALLAVLLTVAIAPLPARWKPFALTLETLLATAFVARLIVVDDDWFARLLSTPLFRWVGRLSYSWYLWQEIFIVTQAPSWGLLRRFPLDLIASFSAALASHYAVERPFLRLKDRAAASGASP